MILPDIFERAGIAVHYSDGDEVTICCPFCSERGETEDKRFRLGVNVRTALAHCYNCGWKGRGVGYIGRQLCRVYGLKFGYKQVHNRESRKQKEEKVEKITSFSLSNIGYEKLKAPWDTVGMAVRDYLRSRGVSILQIVRHHIGYAIAGDMAWRALFPIIDAENVVHGCTGRTIRKGIEPKYLNSTGDKILWNARRKNPNAVVVEGIMDALRVETALLRTRGYDAVARLGSSITMHQMDQIREYEKVIIMPDRDRPGVKGVQELAERCDQRGVDCWVVVPARLDGADPGSMSEEEINHELANVQKWSRSTEFKLRSLAAKYDRFSLEEEKVYAGGSV